MTWPGLIWTLVLALTAAFWAVAAYGAWRLRSLPALDRASADAAPLVGALVAAFGTAPVPRAAAAAIPVAFVLASVLFGRFMPDFRLASFLTPLLVPVTVGAFLRAAWRGWRLGGAEWRGTRYPAADLRAGRRVRVPF